MEGKYNLKSPGVKRLMREALELKDPTELFFVQPLEENLFEWHFTVRGPQDTDFENGVYHGRIVLPTDYPMKPPSILLLTPNGRFEVGTKICLSISGHHPESWQPSWSIRTALLALIGFMPSEGHGAIGSLDYTPKERKVLASKSQSYECTRCGPIVNLLLPIGNNSPLLKEEAVSLASQISFKAESSTSEQTTKKSAESSDIIDGVHADLVPTNYSSCHIGSASNSAPSQCIISAAGSNLASASDLTGSLGSSISVSVHSPSPNNPTLNSNASKILNQSYNSGLQKRVPYKSSVSPSSSSQTVYKVSSTPRSQPAVPIPTLSLWDLKGFLITLMICVFAITCLMVRIFYKQNSQQTSP